jgi:pimeloyl-ACP methyl ester carboxylesterase
MADIFEVAKPAGHPRASVLFVHGLAGHPYDTWRCGTGTKDRDIDPTFWPLWLARDCEGLAIYMIGYEARVSRLRGSAMHFTDQANNLLARILAEPDLTNRPLILIGHSFGGLVIKQLLRTASDTAHSRVGSSDLIKHVEKVAFIATPHSGSSLASCSDRLRILVRPSAATASLVRNDPTLANLNEWYRDWANRHGIAHLILREDKGTSILGIMVVTRDSADPGLANFRTVAIPADHARTCKPAHDKNEIYILVKNFIDQAVNRPSGPSEEMKHARLEQHGAIAKATNAGVEEQTVLELGRRLKPNQDSTQEVSDAVETATEAIKKDDRGSNRDHGAESSLGGSDDIKNLLRWGRSTPASKVKYAVPIVAVPLALLALYWWLWPMEYRVHLPAPENVGYLGPTIEALADKLEEPCGFSQWLPFWPRRCAKIEFEDDAVRKLVVSQPFDMTSRDPLAILLALRQTYQPCFNITGVAEGRLRLHVDEREVSRWQAPDGTSYRLCRTFASAQDVLARRHGGQ